MSENRESKRGFAGGRGMGQVVEKPKNFKASVGKLMKYISAYKISLIVVLIAAIGSTIFSIIGPKLLGNATTEIFNGLLGRISGGSGIDFGKIGSILIMMAVLYTISAVLSFLQGFVMSGLSQKLTFRFRKEMSEKLHRLPMNYFDTKTHGEILSRFTNDVDTLNQSLNQSITQVITSVTTLIGILFMMLSINWTMTLVALLILPISMIIIGATIKKSQKFFKEQQAFLGNVNGQIEEIYGGHTIVKGFNYEGAAIKDFEEENNKLYNSGWKAQFFSGMMQPIMGFVGNIGYVVIAVLGGYFAVTGKIVVGEIQSFIQYTKNFTQPITQIAQVSNLLQSTAAAAERIFEFLEEEEEDQVVENPVSIEGMKGEVTFNDMSFGYVKDQTIIHHLNVEVEQGQKIAIVGPTGAGKTTIVKLLMRFYDVDSGQICIDGHPVEAFDRGELRSLFGMVLQDTWLFNGTIRDNIRYGRFDATDEQVVEAAKAAHVHHFIQTLPGGYDMVINEEANNISQGQKQLLTIARAFLADPKILILDEATSSVDTRTEVRIQKAMENLMKGRTSFVIAHRLSTIKDADRILVLKDGDIVEQGSNDELLAMNGFYYQLYNAQFNSGESA